MNWSNAQIATPVASTTAPSVLTTKDSRTVLVVDDDRATRRYLEVLLQQAGYTVITATDGLEAMQTVLSFAVDAVVSDTIMPHLSGDELCGFLRRHPQLSQMPIVLLSALDPTVQSSKAAATQNESNRVAADAYLSKPLRPQELTSCLAQLLSLAPVVAATQSLCAVNAAQLS